MERKLFRKILLDFGYSDDSVKKIFQGRMVPTLKKALTLEQKHGIPVHAWLDIKSYVYHAQSMPEQTVHDQVEPDEKSHLKETA